ncbi:Chymotrypsin-like protease CTRL-1 [Aix galericulata]|nr:Chymotrypsin-like protease CTRL-1 [Aix galericulata]
MQCPAPGPGRCPCRFVTVPWVRTWAGTRGDPHLTACPQPRAQPQLCSPFSSPDPYGIPLLRRLPDQPVLGGHGCPLRIQVRSDALQHHQPQPPAPLAPPQSPGLQSPGARCWLPRGSLTPPHTSCSPYSHVVVLGEYDRSSGSEAVQVKTVTKVSRVDAAVTHPNWDSYNLNNDITLLKLSSPAQLGPRVAPVCLAPANLALPSNLQCVTTGWGRTNTNSNALAVRLQQVTLPLVSQSQCMQYWGSSITSSMLCAGGVGASSCQGDSGGPLVYQNGNVWTLIGIVSWGSSNCNIRTPAVYTRVSQFRNWIDYIVAQG